MRVTRQTWWRGLHTPIVGFDEGGEGGAGEGAGGAPGAPEGGQGSGQGSPAPDEGGNSPSEDTAGLKSALQKEREGRKSLEKELARFRKAEEDRANAEKSEIERATQAAQKEAEKVARLAGRLRENAVNDAVLRAAAAAKFLDPTDALRPEVLTSISVEQDEDDPSNISIDQATVTAAVRALAKSKPHYLTTSGTPGATPSGSKFGGGRQAPSEDAQRAGLVAKYPALASRFPQPTGN